MNFGKSIINFSYVSLGRAVGAGIAAIFYFVLAIILEPELYGEINYLIAIAGTSAIISRFGFNHTVTVYQAKNNLTMVNQVNILAVIFTSIAAIIVLSINVFAALLLVSLTFFIMNQHNLLGLQKYKQYMVYAILKNGLLLVFPISFYFLFGISGVLIGISISNFLCCFEFIRKLQIKLQPFSEIKKNYRIIMHNFGVDISSNLSRHIDKLFIAPILGFGYIGIYQLNLQFLFALEMLPLSVHSFLLSEEARGKVHTKIIYFSVLLSVILSTIIIFISPFLITNFFPKYSEGIDSLQIIIISLIPLTISAIFNAKLQALESTKIGFSAIIRIGSLIILILTLGDWLGLMGLSLSVLLSSIFYTLFLASIYYKRKQIKSF